MKKNVITLTLFFTHFVSANVQIVRGESPKAEAVTVGYISLTNEIYDFNDIVKELKKYCDDPSVDCIVLHISSPGRSPGVAEIIAEFILWLKETKPIIGFISHMGASAGYTIAAACTHIIAPATAQIGSIGVVMEIPKKNKTIAFTGGEFKRPHYLADGVIDPEHVAVIKEKIDLGYSMFCDYISKLRKIPSETIRGFKAQTFMGVQALELGLIDQIGTIRDVFDKAVEMVADKKNSAPTLLRLIVSPTDVFEFAV